MAWNTDAPGLGGGYHVFVPEGLTSLFASVKEPKPGGSGKSEIFSKQQEDALRAWIPAQFSTSQRLPIKLPIK